MDKKQENLYKNLLVQVQKIRNHNRQGSFKTKQRYYEANDRFCKFLAKKFGTQKFANIQDKHIEAYIKDMQERGLAASTIKTDLGAIRFYHDKTDSKFELSGNEKYTLEKRKFGGVDRSWSNEEYQKFKKTCEFYGNERVEAVAVLARNEGLRIHETTRMDRAQVESALHTGELFVKGKGGKERTVPLSSESREMLKQIIQDIPRGEKLFVRNDEKTHLVIKQIQNFIVRHRSEWQQTDREENKEENRTFHGLRHMYAKDRYDELKKQGKSDYEAREAVSRLLGHERDDVTRIYLAKGGE